MDLRSKLKAARQEIEKVRQINQQCLFRLNELGCWLEDLEVENEKARAKRDGHDD